MAVVTDEVRRQFIADNVSSDLQYFLDEAGISLANQYAITQLYRNLRQFRSIADQKTDLREALKADFALDPATSPAVRAEVAKVVAAWEVASELASKEQELKAESKIFRPSSELASQRATGYDQVCGRGARQVARGGNSFDRIFVIEGRGM